MSDFMSENITEKNGSAVQVEAESFTCPNCGGTLTYNIKDQKFMCGSCRTEHSIETVTDSVKEYNFSEYLSREKKTVPFEGIATVSCDKCGAEITFSKYQFASVCPMCAGTQIASEKQKACIPPEGIVPFKVDKQDAQQRFRVWVKGRWFAPNDFKKSYGEGGLSGMYLPFWTYDSDAMSSYSGMGGRHRIVYDKDGKSTMTTDWYPVSGIVKNYFDDVLVCASDKEKQINAILPYRTTTEAVPYSNAYLSGYYAEFYKFKADSCFEQAKQIMDSHMRSLAESQIRMHYDEARVTFISTKHSNVKYKYILLPLWGSVFGYKGKKYRYLINGETGKVAGERPYSIPKITAAVIAGIIALLLIFMVTNESEARYGFGGRPAVCAEYRDAEYGLDMAGTIYYKEVII